MLSARAAFRKSDLLIHANVMPGESVPEDDEGYLRGIYQLADSPEVGVGGPDLLPKRWYQQQHSLQLIAARAQGTVVGLAVQDGNLADIDWSISSPSSCRGMIAVLAGPILHQPTFAVTPRALACAGRSRLRKQ